MRMDKETQLEDLKSTAAKLSIDIEFSNLSDNEISIQSGYCRVKGRDIIIMDRHLSQEEQIELLLKTLRRFDLENIFLPAWMREQLETGTAKIDSA